MNDYSPAVKKAMERFQKKLAVVRAVGNTPRELDRITDVVLAYRPKPKSKGAKKRVRKAKKAKADDG
jgi:hypothetical protein